MLPIINRFAIVILTSVVCAAATAATTQKTTKAKQPSALKVKQGNYTPRGKLTRREFVEKAFGVKFGEELAKYVKPDNDGDADLGVMHKKLASPVCGLKDALFFVSRSGELERIQLSPQSPAKREQGIKATKARLDRFSQTAGKWLGIKSFESQESIVGDSEEGKAWNLARVFEEDGLKVKAAVECIEKGKSVMAYGCSLTISFTEAKATGTTEDTQVDLNVKARSGDRPPAAVQPIAPTPEPEEEKARAERFAQRENAAKEAKVAEARMRKIIIPRVRFGPPATMVDAVEVFKAWSKEYDDHELPEEKRGFNFAFMGASVNTKIPEIPRIDESNISLWDALDKVCSSCDWKFVVSDGRVLVMHKTMTADQLLTRSYPFPDEVKALLDEKAGTTAIHTKVCAGDDAAYEEMYAKYKAWFETQGVDWPIQNENRRAGIVYARATERLRVTNTEDNLDKIEKLLAK